MRLVGSTVGPMTGDEIRRAQFREARRGGYRTEDVDPFLERLAAAADRAEPIMPWPRTSR